MYSLVVINTNTCNGADLWLILQRLTVCSWNAYYKSHMQGPFSRFSFLVRHGVIKRVNSGERKNKNFDNSIRSVPKKNSSAERNRESATCLKFLFDCARVGQNGEVAWFTLLYCWNFMRV